MTSGATPAQPRTETLVPSGGLRALVEALERLGHDRASLLAAARATRAQLEDPDALVPASAVLTVIEHAQRERPRRNFALRLAESTPIGAYPLVDHLVLSSGTVGEGLRRLARYYRLVGAPYTLQLSEDQDPIRVGLSCLGPAFFVEYSVALPLLHLRREGGATAEYASLPHAPDDPEEFSTAVGCPLHLNPGFGGFALSRATWAQPMRRRDPALLGVLERHAEAVIAQLPRSAASADEVRHALASAMAEGSASLGAVAQALAVSRRTLQRRLASEGTSFQEQLDLARREAAERHLRGSTLSIAEISFVLGYSEPAAFHRAFRRWHRTTPQSFRAAGLTGSSPPPTPSRAAARRGA